MKKCLFAIVGALSLLTLFSTVALAAPVKFGGTVGITAADNVSRKCWHVYYRDCPRSPWQCYGKYYCPHEAEDVACSLRDDGYYAYVD